MPSNRPPHCPLCGFGFAWDGDSCGHCRFPADGRRRWAALGSLTLLWDGTPDISFRTAARFAVACLGRGGSPLRGGAVGDIVEWLRGVAEGTAPAEPADPTALTLLESWRAGPILPPDESVPNWHGQLLRAVVWAAELARAGADPLAAARAAARCVQYAAAWRDYPMKDRLAHPLPAELEPYRAEVAAMTRAEQDELYRRDPDDPVRQAYQHLWRSNERYASDRRAAALAEEAAHCDLFRDLVPYPFEPAEFDPDWRTRAAVALARTLYESGDFATIPVLADALQDAGCEDPDVLGHCRDPDQPHVRGCWVVEAVLADN